MQNLHRSKIKKRKKARLGTTCLPILPKCPQFHSSPDRKVGSTMTQRMSPSPLPVTQGHSWSLATPPTPLPFLSSSPGFNALTSGLQGRPNSFIPPNFCSKCLLHLNCLPPSLCLANISLFSGSCLGRTGGLTH